MSFSINKGDSKVTGDFSQLEKLVKELGKKHYVDIGILGSGEAVEGEELTIAGIGAVHEFGRLDGTIPARSFIKMPLEEKQSDIQKKVDAVSQEKIEKGDIKGVFKLIGLAGEAAIQEAFETGGFGNWEDIKEATKKRKGSEAILIDEGVLRKAVTSKVGGGE